MGVESNPTLPDKLDPSWPLDADVVADGADHVRNLKSVMRNMFKDLDGALLTTGDRAYGGTLDSVFFPRCVMIMCGKTTAHPTPLNPVNAVGGSGALWVKAGYIPLSLTSNDGQGTVTAFEGMKELVVWVRGQDI